MIPVVLLANVSSLYAVARPSVVCLSVTFVRPSQAVVIFRNISTAFGTLAIDIHEKFYGDRPRGTPPPGELNTRGVAKYSDFGPVDGYISETVQDRT